MPDFQQMYSQGGSFKEQLEAIVRSWRGKAWDEETKISTTDVAPETMKVIPSGVEEEKLKEAEGYMEKVEKETELQKPVVDDYTNQVLLKSTVKQDPKVKLPLDDNGIKTGMKRSVWEGIRWLALWCLRQMQMAGR